mmetsp:Transcript_31430/g.92154  ORF Transcript_31430/g.92154 Transcript_31430/m.92154 type:complete len:285 (+) Transcript_31430:104-958(+)
MRGLRCLQATCRRGVTSTPARQFGVGSSEPWYGSPRPARGVGSSGSDDSSSSSQPHLSPPLFASGLTPLERVGVAIHSATTALADPTRADAVAALGEVTGHVALQSIHRRMHSDPTGKRILQDRPLVDNASIDIEHLSQTLPLNTFGHQYASFMMGHGFDPDGRAAIKFIADPELAYIMLRYRQCHDFWHTLTGLPPTVLGELALKWLEVIQTGLPVAALSATVGSLRLSAEERRILNEVYLPWAVRVGRNSEYLLNVYYEEEFESDIEELRARLRIEKVPSFD